MSDFEKLPLRTLSRDRWVRPASLLIDKLGHGACRHVAAAGGVRDLLRETDPVLAGSGANHLYRCLIQPLRQL